MQFMAIIQGVDNNNEKSQDGKTGGRLRADTATCFWWEAFHIHLYPHKGLSTKQNRKFDDCRRGTEVLNEFTIFEKQMCVPGANDSTP